MKTTKYFLLLVLTMTLMSCATRQERAQRKLAKAISLDPSIIQSKVLVKDSVRIRDSIRIKDSVTIIPKSESRLTVKADTVTKLLKPFDFTTGIGPYQTRMWVDELGDFHYWNKIDSVVNKTKELEKVSAKQESHIEYQDKIIKIIEYRVILWQLALAGVFGFFVAFIPKIFKWVLSKAFPG